MSRTRLPFLPTPKDAPPSIRAQKLHVAWNLRCCTTEELDFWLGPEKALFVRGGNTFDAFCDEGRSSWCKAQAAKGLCVRKDAPQPPDYFEVT